MNERTYETEDLIIYWKPELCKHAGKCVHGAPKIFEVGRKPWIEPEKGSTEQITNVIDKCPSGALSYKMK